MTTEESATTTTRRMNFIIATKSGVLGSGVNSSAFFGKEKFSIKQNEDGRGVSLSIVERQVTWAVNI